MILPLIREVFHKTYPDETVIRLIATEYVVRRIHKEEGSTLNSVYADIAVQIGKRDIYHLECQMNKDKGMVLRMLEYDIHIGLTHGIEITSDKLALGAGMEMLVPRSVILYLNHIDNVPSEETCTIRFADGTSCKYHVPVMKVQNYSLKMIEEKHLIMLIPFLPIRFRKYLEQKPISEAVRKELTEFIRKCIMIIEREKTNGTLTGLVDEDLIEFLSITCDYLFKNEPELYKEVHELMNPTIKLTRERADEIVKLTRERADEIVKLTRERAAEAEAEAEKATAKIECSIGKFIQVGQQNGQRFQEVKENLQNIFSLSDAEADEKMNKYWEN